MVNLSDLKVCSQCGTVYNPASFKNFGQCPVCQKSTISETIYAV